MPTFDRPDSLPLWCENNPQSTAQPPVTLREAGYVANEPPVAEHWNYWLNLLGHWVAYLDQSDGANVTATALNFDLRLVGGGSWSFVASTKILAWTESVQLAVPGLANTENTLAAGSATLAQGQVLWVNANIPYTTKGDLASGSTQLTNVLATDAIAIGQVASGDGLPSGTTVTAVNDAQVTLSQAATKTQAGTALTFHANGPLSARVTDMASFTPGPNAVVLAIAGATEVTVGANSGQMVVRDGESKRLLGAGYVSIFRAPAGAALTANQACYLSAGASDGSRTAGALYPADSSAGNGAERGQFLGFTPSAAASGSTAMVVTSGVLNGFSGLSVGAVYYLDPTSPGGVTTTKPTAVGQYVVPIGLALSTTALRVNPAGTHSLVPISNDLEVVGNLQVDGTTKQIGRVTGNTAAYTGDVTANTFSSSGGFKTCIYAGALYTTQAQANTAYPLTQLDTDSTNQPNGNFFNYQVPMGYAGNLVKVTYQSNSYASGGGVFLTRINGQNLQFTGFNEGTGVTGSVNFGSAGSTFGAFKAGDLLDIQMRFNSGGFHWFRFWFWVALDTGTGF